MDEKLNENIRNMAITKRLNFLVGSGTSVPAIPLMKDKIYLPKGKEGCKWEDLTASDKLAISNNLNSKTKAVSKEILLGAESVQSTQTTYNEFLQTILDILNLSNSRNIPKNANIFTTNYDIFIEKAADNMLGKNRLIFNDGASGYFNRYLSSSNYNRLVSYKGLNDNYIAEIPAISLIKPHGSMNWEKVNNNIKIENSISSNPVIVSPTGYESADTFLQNHFYEMLRIFETELDKQQAVLFIIGFSFQDKHIGKMIKRAMQNPELMIYAFGYSEEDKDLFLNNLDLESGKNNFVVLTPHDFDKGFKTWNGNTCYHFTLKNLIDVLGNTPKEDFE